MPTTVTIKSQITIPKHIRDALNLVPGSLVEFTVNRDGEIVIQKAGARLSLGTVRLDAML